VYDLQQFVDFPTRGENILDLVYSDCECVVTELPHLGTSDHVAMMIKITMNVELPSPPPVRTVLHYSSAPWNHINGHLKKTLAGWNPRSLGTVDAALDDMYDKVGAAIKRYIRSSIPAHARPAPWWDSHCTKALKIADKTFSARNEDPDAYKKARQVLKTRQRQAYAVYRSELTKKIAESGPTKDWWDTAKLYAGRTRSRTAGAPPPQELAEFFAEKLSLDGEEDEVPEFEPVDRVNFTSFRVTKKRVLKVLKTLDPRKSANGISNRFLKECGKALAPAVTLLFRMIVDLAVWPSKWKTGRISAIWKRGSNCEAKNYRPVTVLDGLSLCLERTLDPQLDGFLVRFKSPCQYGFTRKCGTQDYGAALSMELHHRLEDRLEVILVALDVAGAFDKVWWKALLKNLAHCGMRGKAHRLMCSYLSDRSLFVVALGVASEILRYSCGVPQGGIWSPKLWNFHIRELIKVLKHCALYCYADDLTLKKLIGDLEDAALNGDKRAQRFAERRQEALCEINEDLSLLATWGRKWKVKFEPTKTHAMHISNHSMTDVIYPEICRLELDGKRIAFEQELLIVGFLFDSKLSWEPMVKRACSKGRSALGAIRRLQGLFGPSDLAILFKSFVRSVMEYGLLVYFGATEGNLAKLDAIQSSAERLCETKFRPLSDRRDAAAFGLICKLLDGECVDQLQGHAPQLLEVPAQRVSQRVGSSGGPQLVNPSKRHETGLTKSHNRLKTFSRSLPGQLHRIFADVPEDVRARGVTEGWRAAMKPGQSFLGGKDWFKQSKEGSDAMMESYGFYLTNGMWKRRKD